MKRKLEYDELVGIGKTVAAKVRSNTLLVAVSRGGLSLAHIVAFNSKSQLGFFSPKDNELLLGSSERKKLADPTAPIIFVEDLYAKGRTYNLIRKYIEDTNIPNPWSMEVVVVDGRVPEREIPSNLSFAYHTNDWLVFPHEDYDTVQEFDWGLNRDGTARNSG